MSAIKQKIAQTVKQKETSIMPTPYDEGRRISGGSVQKSVGIKSPKRHIAKDSCVKEVQLSTKKDKVKLLDEAKFVMFNTEKSLDNTFDIMSPPCPPAIRDNFKKYAPRVYTKDGLPDTTHGGIPRTPTGEIRSCTDEVCPASSVSDIEKEIQKLDCIIESGRFISLERRNPGPHCEALLQRAQVWIDHEKRPGMNIVDFLKEFNNAFRVIRDRYRRAALIEKKNHYKEWTKNMRVLAVYSVYVLRMEEYWHAVYDKDCTAVQMCFLHEMSDNKLLNF